MHPLTEAVKRVQRTSNQHKYVWRNMLEHVLIVERLLGKALPQGVQIHHVDGNGLNNAHCNLVVCPNRAYHSLLHERTKALDACGNPNWRRCCFCKRWDAAEHLAFWKRGSTSGAVIAHRQCANEALQSFKKRNPEYVAKHLALRRKRYAEDAELRARVKARQRRYNATISKRNSPS